MFFCLKALDISAYLGKPLKTKTLIIIIIILLVKILILLGKEGAPFETKEI
jgi:hypothetical protein